MLYIVIKLMNNVNVNQLKIGSFILLYSTMIYCVRTALLHKKVYTQQYKILNYIYDINILF